MAPQDAVEYVRVTARSDTGSAEVGMYKVAIYGALVNGRVDVGRELLQELKDRNMPWDDETWCLQLEATVRHQGLVQVQV